MVFATLKYMNTEEKLLLLSCCAPCAGGALSRLAAERRAVTVLFYNPNIYPFSEYEKRRDEQKRACEHFHIDFVELPYEPAAWDEAVRGLEAEPERGKRCYACFLMRLKRAAAYAREHGFARLSSVLGVSRYKDLEQVNRAAREACAGSGVFYDETNWRRHGVEELRRAVLKELNFYSQRYCGCRCSLAARRREKEEKPV